MVVAFIDSLAEGQIVEPPKLPHITIKKKFKLLDINETQLINMLQTKENIKGVLELRLGDTKDYNSEDNKVVGVLNPDSWVDLHNKLINYLGKHIESRDGHFEGVNYLPHMTWKLKGSIMFDPKPLCNTIRVINSIYLIKRLDPQITRAKILALINI